MYWCIYVWYTYVSIKDCGLKLNTPWNVREGVNTPTFGVNECQITVKKSAGGRILYRYTLTPTYVFNLGVLVY